MATSTQTLRIDIVADDRVLKRVLGDAKRNVSSFSRDVQQSNAAASAGFLGGAGGGLTGRGSKLNQGLRGGLSGFGAQSSFLFGSGAFIGAAAAVGSIKLAVDAASDLNEQITKTQQVFGGASKSVLDWSKDTATSMGIARNSALQTVSTFGNLFSAQGFGNLENSKLSRGLVKLASDLASFNNVDVTQVLQDLQSGIVGEIEPVRKYGADLRVARVQQEALAESGKENVKQLTRQELTLARIKLLYRDTTKAQGDFARTSGGLANQERILTAQVSNLAANLGTLLLPAVDNIVVGLNSLVSVANEGAKALQKLADIKLPAIHVPFLFDIPGGGGKIGNIAKDVAKFSPLTNPLFGATVIKALHDQIVGGTDKAAKADAPRAAEQSAVVFSDFVDNVLTSAMKLTKPNVSFNDLFTNVLSGLKTQLGPVLKDIPKKLQESLLDVQIATPDNHSALIAVLEKQKNSLEQALKDPRLKRDDRIGIKEKLKGVIGAIDSENAAIKASIAEAGAKRTAALEDAKNKAEAAKQKQVDLLAKIKEARQQAAQKAAESLQVKQFRELGLSGTGDEIVPGIKNLTTRVNSALTRINNGQLNVSNKVADSLRGARKTINKEGDNLTKTTREKINEFIKAASGDDAAKKLSGPLTATTSLNTNKILKGLGLSGDLAKELRSRLSPFNSAGVALAGTGVAARAGGFPVFPGGSQVNVDVTLDGEKIAKNTTIHQGKRARRNPRQKRGPSVHNF